MSRLVKSETFRFIMVMMLCIYFYFLFGISEYQTYDVYGQPVTVGTPNLFGGLALVLPLIIYAYWYYNKKRKKEWA